MSKAKIKWSYYDNEQPAHVLQNLKGYIYQRQTSAAGNLGYWYVGQTDCPEKRLEQHQRRCDENGWDRWTHMFVIYGHWELHYVTQVENSLIEYVTDRAGRQREDDRVFNVSGSRLEGQQTYSVYVLIDDHPTRSGGFKRQFREPEDNVDHETFVWNTRCDRDTRISMVRRRFNRAIQVTEDGEKRPARYIYVGRTNSPDRRFTEHQLKMTKEFGGKLWENMRVVYQTSSLTSAVRMETMLIEYAREKFRNDDDVYVHNTAPGQYAEYFERGEAPHFYVYYLEDRR